MAKKKVKRKLKNKLKNTIKKLSIAIIIIILIVTAIKAGEYYLTYNEELKPVSHKKEYYNISDFGFVREKSDSDYDEDGIDDYTEFLNGEKKYAEFNPKYISKYYAGGYPPVEEEGVCTDLIWYALKEAGYSLKDMIVCDIHEQAKKDTYEIEIIDDNIDFRRVSNQEIFFQRYAKTLDNDIYNIGEFMPGDIISFDYSAHIAMISDKYNVNGVPYLIQNRDETQKEKEEDRLEETDMVVTGHYRFEYNEEIQELINRMST